MTIVLDLDTKAIVSVLIRLMQVMAKPLCMYRQRLLNWYDNPISTGPFERHQQ